MFDGGGNRDNPTRLSAQERAAHRWGCSHSEHISGLDGSSNSHTKDSYCPPTSRIGVDTISWAWSETEAVDRFLRLDGIVPPGSDERPLRIVPAALGAVRVNRRIDGLGTLGAFPSASLIYVEGRASALLARDESDHGLGRPRDLGQVRDQVVDELGRLLGSSLRAPAGLRRADLAGECLFDRGEDGSELLELLDAMHSPHHKTAPVRERGGARLETATWKTPVRFRSVMRAYDKGVESGTAGPGERVRLERQLRYSGQKRPTMEQWLAGDLGDLYARPIRSWIRNGVAAGTPEQLIRVLTDAAVIWPNYWASGSSWVGSSGTVHVPLWPARKVERVLGTLAVAQVYGRQWPAWSPKQRQRRMAEVRELGLLLTDRPVRVDVDQAVTGLCELWREAA